MVEDDDIQSREKNKNPFGWYSIIFNLAQEDILKIPEVVQINHIEVFNFLTYQSDLYQQREREMKQKFKL